MFSICMLAVAVVVVICILADLDIPVPVKFGVLLMFGSSMIGMMSLYSDYISHHIKTKFECTVIEDHTTRFKVIDSSDVVKYISFQIEK